MDSSSESMEVKITIAVSKAINLSHRKLMKTERDAGTEAPR